MLDVLLALSALALGVGAPAQGSEGPVPVITAEEAPRFLALLEPVHEGQVFAQGFVLDGLSVDRTVLRYGFLREGKPCVFSFDVVPLVERREVLDKILEADCPAFPGALSAGLRDRLLDVLREGGRLEALLAHLSHDSVFESLRAGEETARPIVVVVLLILAMLGVALDWREEADRRAGLSLCMVVAASLLLGLWLHPLSVAETAASRVGIALALGALFHVLLRETGDSKAALMATGLVGASPIVQHLANGPAPSSMAACALLAAVSATQRWGRHGKARDLVLLGLGSAGLGLFTGHPVLVLLAALAPAPLAFLGGGARRRVVGRSDRGSWAWVAPVLVAAAMGATLVFGPLVRAAHESTSRAFLALGPFLTASDWSKTYALQLDYCHPVGIFLAVAGLLYALRARRVALASLAAAALLPAAVIALLGVHSLLLSVANARAMNVLAAVAFVFLQAIGSVALISSMDASRRATQLAVLAGAGIFVHAQWLSEIVIGQPLY